MSISGILFALSLLLVIFSFMGGMVAMVRGRSEDAKLSNTFMRIRVAAQALAIVTVLFAIAFS